MALKYFRKLRGRDIRKRCSAYSCDSKSIKMGVELACDVQAAKVSSQLHKRDTFHVLWWNHCCSLDNGVLGAEMGLPRF